MSVETNPSVLSAAPALFLESTPLLSNPAALRARAEEYGYLFFRGLVPPADVQAVRTDLLHVMNEFGWLSQKHPLDEGIVDIEAVNLVPEPDMRTDIGVSHDMYDAVQKLESVHRLPHHPNLLALYRALFGSEVLVHPRHIVRMVTPHHAMVPTPVHQDFPLIQGTSNTWTCWLPVGDCPRELGGLTVLQKSQKSGYLPIEYAKGAGSIAAQLCPGEQDWVEGDFEMGDVLTFSSFTVHRALPCRFPDRVRLSFDVRYQSIDEPVEEKSLLPHCHLTWDEVYENWSSDELQYYWRKLPLQMSPWDNRYMEPSRRIC